MNSKKFYLGIITTALVVIVFFSLIYYFLYTTDGSSFIIRFVLSRYIGSDQFVVEKVEGNLLKELSLHNITVKNSKYLPPEAIIKIQRLDIAFISRGFEGLLLNVYNGRLQLAYSDTILFYGSYRRKLLDVVLYSKRVNAREMLDLFTQRSVLSTVSGTFTDVTVHATGTLFSVALEGRFFVEKLSNDSFSIVDCPGSVMIYLGDIKRKIRLDGEIVLRQGILSGRKTAQIMLRPGKIIFEGQPKNPRFNLRGKAVVEKTEIAIVLQGTVDSPRLQLSSHPPQTEELLLIMLATNRSWGVSETSLKQGKISVDLIKDFIDYFIFAGEGSKIAQRFGINDVSITYDQQTRGIDVKTSIAGKVEVRYKLEPPQEEIGNTAAKHTVGGGYKITETISVEAEKELKQEEISDEDTKEETTDDKLYLQYKKAF